MTAIVNIFVESSIRSMVLGAAVALILYATQVRSGAVRHAAWTAVLCAMLLMPVLPSLLPPVPVPVQIPAIALDLADISGETSSFKPESFRPSTSPTPVTAPLSILHATPPHRPAWPLVVLAVYGFGAMGLFLRLMLGWYSVQRIARASQPVPELSVFESPLVVTPLTMGFIAPKITLPMNWRTWPPETLGAVLAHERAHVARRDTIVAMLSHFNQCIFWFHPLAWWLDRTLAANAEDACDDAGIQAAGDSQRYAGILLDLARTVQQRGGRFMWQGIGMNGASLLGDRIHRILTYDEFAPVSASRRAVVAFGCAAAILGAAACSRQVPPLQDDPTIAEQQQRIKSDLDMRRASIDMNRQQVADLEDAIRKNEEDLASRKKLLIFYTNSGDQSIDRREAIAARRRHILWLIEHHPEHELTGSWEARIFPTAADKNPDPAGYEQAKSFWLAQADRPNANVDTLSNAAHFFWVADKRLAEKVLLRAQALAPSKRWSAELGRVYAEVIVGSNASMPMGAIRSINLASAHGPFANEVRKKLSDSQDAALLGTTGQMLINWSSQTYITKEVDFDIGALALSYLERASQLDPGSARARGVLLSARFYKARLLEAIPRGSSAASQYEIVSAVPEPERFHRLSRLAESAYIRGDMLDYYEHDAAGAKLAWAIAGKSARDVLQLAPKFRNDSNYGTAVYRANITLGMVAMRNGNRKAATQYLIEASKVPATEELAYLSDYFTLKLPAWLLKDGERSSVIEFLERFAKINVSQKADLLHSATLIRNGKKPGWYPR